MLYFYNPSLPFKINFTNYNYYLKYHTDPTQIQPVIDAQIYYHFENENNLRFITAHNPIFKYDYKTGDYFPKHSMKAYNHLLMSMIHLSNTQHSL